MSIPFLAPTAGAPAARYDDGRPPLHRPRRSAPHRVVTQAERLWIVREADTTLAPDAPRDHCLVCESALSVRYTWQYPPEWAGMPDAELLQLFG